MPSVANIKSISYLKSHAAQISIDLEMNGNPFFITQNGDASMVIESIKQYEQKESLIAALKSGKLAAAGLDVFRGEPKLHSGYLDLPNAFLLPHLGSATVETRNAMGFCCLKNLDAFFAGREVPNRIA